MNNKFRHYTLIELLVATGVFMLILVLALRFYHSSQSFMLRGTSVASHTSAQAFVLNYLSSDLQQLNKSNFLDLSGSTPEEKVIPVTRVSNTHYRFYSTTYDENNLFSATTKAISIRLVNGQLLRSVQTVSATATFPYSAGQWTSMESNSSLLASEVESFTLTFYSDASWDGAKTKLTTLNFSGSPAVNTEHPIAIGISLSTARVISSSNSAAVTAAIDQTKQTVPFLVYTK